MQQIKRNIEVACCFDVHPERAMQKLCGIQEVDVLEPRTDDALFLDALTAEAERHFQSQDDTLQTCLNNLHGIYNERYISRSFLPSCSVC